MSKKFKDTAFGKLLIQKIPKAAEIIGEALPGTGVLGIAKNLISKSHLSEHEKAALENNRQEYEMEVFKLEVADKESARKREVEKAKIGQTDWMFIATGCAIIAAFILCVLAVIFIGIPKENKEIFVHLMGIVEGAFIGGMVFYYFGAVKTSK